MAQNEIPRNYDPLVELLEDAADGAFDHGGSVGLLQNNHAALRAVLVALVGAPAGPGGSPAAQPGLKAVWNNAKAVKVAGTGAYRSAKSSGRTLAKACVNVLKPRLGDSWSNAWQTAGFTGGSIAIPENPLTLLQQLRAYFLANPSHEITNVAASLDATAQACNTAAEAISDASNASNNSNVAAGTAKRNYEDGIAAARSRLSGLRDELTQLLRGDDERWYAFGFERPDDPETPEVPENLTVVGGGQGMGFADFDDARRADSYRVRVLNHATNAALAEKLTQESEAAFTGLPVGPQLRLEVTAINDAGESQPGTLLFTLS